MCQSYILNLVALEPRVETNFVRVGKQNLGHEELTIEVVNFTEDTLPAILCAGFYLIFFSVAISKCLEQVLISKQE